MGVLKKHYGNDADCLLVYQRYDEMNDVLSRRFVKTRLLLSPYHRIAMLSVDLSGRLQSWHRTELPRAVERVNECGIH